MNILKHPLLNNPLPALRRALPESIFLAKEDLLAGPRYRVGCPEWGPETVEVPQEVVTLMEELARSGQLPPEQELPVLLGLLVRHHEQEAQYVECEPV